MSQPIVMPNLGMDMTEGTLLNWTKNVGDAINPGDVIAEVETDKTAIEVATEVGGTILQLIGAPGEMLTVGTTIGYVGEAGEKPANGGAPEAKPAAASAPAPAEERAPTAPSNEAGSYQREKPVDRGEETAEPVQETSGNGNGSYPGGVKASPIARAVASERGVDLQRVKGTGPGGRVTKADVMGFTPADMPAAPVSSPSAPAATAGGAAHQATYGKLPEGPDVEIIDTSNMRRRIGDRMLNSKQGIPHFYVTSEIDVEAVLNLRKQLNENLDEASKISVNDLIVKAVALTLRKFPNLNSHFYGDKIVRHKRINIGIAVALPNGGLMNVVAHDADKASLSAMAAHNKEMIERARAGKVKPDDVSGGTFTVSNLGVYDVEDFVAIINPPEAGILAVGSAKKMPIVKPDGTIGIGTRMRVTASVDHRVSDGAEGAQFLQELKKLIESPMRLLV